MLAVADEEEVASASSQDEGRTQSRSYDTSALADACNSGLPDVDACSLDLVCTLPIADPQGVNVSAVLFCILSNTSRVFKVDFGKPLAVYCKPARVVLHFHTVYDVQLSEFCAGVFKVDALLVHTCNCMLVSIVSTNHDYHRNRWWEYGAHLGEHVGITAGPFNY
jgi:hypothetical protein